MKISICCITYNHAPYIEKALKSFLEQDCNFEFEIVIGDDYSTDATKEICKKYNSLYPTKIKLLDTERNVGPVPNFLRTLNACTGEYIAICEGDDYWIDNKKLQTQVDFLEKNKEYVICFHRVYELLENGKLILPEHGAEDEKSYDIEDLAKGNIIQTPSVVFRNKLFHYFPDWYYKSPVGDYILHMLNARYGKLKYFPTPMAVYRKHGGGIWSTQSRIAVLRKWMVVLDLLMNDSFDKKIVDILSEQKRNNINYLLNSLISIDTDSFLEELKKHVEDEKLVQSWLFEHYPNYINSIKNSRSYKLADKLSKVNSSLKRLPFLSKK